MSNQVLLQLREMAERIATTPGDELRRQLLDESQIPEPIRFVLLFRQLDKWLSEGGYFPAPWKPQDRTLDQRRDRSQSVDCADVVNVLYPSCVVCVAARYEDPQDAVLWLVTEPSLNMTLDLCPAHSADAREVRDPYAKCDRHPTPYARVASSKKREEKR